MLFDVYIVTKSFKKYLSVTYQHRTYPVLKQLVTVIIRTNQICAFKGEKQESKTYIVGFGDTVPLSLAYTMPWV
jgi:hypothetical protein